MSENQEHGHTPVEQQGGQTMEELREQLAYAQKTGDRYLWIDVCLLAELLEVFDRGDCAKE